MSITERYAAIRLPRPGLARLLRKVFVLLRRRARHARRLSDLSHLDDRLLYDLGIDPLDLHGALGEQRSRIGLVRLAMRRRLDHS